MASWQNVEGIITSECSTYGTPKNDVKLFRVPSVSPAGGGIGFLDGQWIAGDGAGGTIDLGSYDAGIHTLVSLRLFGKSCFATFLARPSLTSSCAVGFTE